MPRKPRVELISAAAPAMLHHKAGVRSLAHRYYPSSKPYPCAWRCVCGDWFVVCICGACPNVRAAEDSDAA